MTTSNLEKAVQYRNHCAENLRHFIISSRLNGKSGRKPKNISVINITDALRRHTSIADTSHFLGVSRGFIYERVKNPKDYLAEVRK